jgi:hypothetical protein
VSLEDGAKFKGAIEMDPQAVQSATGRNKPAQAAAPAPRPQGSPQMAPNPGASSAVKSAT